jgi:hypothetical protein
MNSKVDFDHVEVNAVSIADLVAGLSSPVYVKTQSSRFGDDWRPTVMHDSVAGDPMWFVQDSVQTGALSKSTIRVIKETDLLTTPSFTVTTLTVAGKFFPVNPLQPDATAVDTTRNLVGEVLKAAEYNDTLVATQQISPNSVGNEDDARWYRIDVSSGTPTLVDEGNVSAGPSTYITYPAIDINASGIIGMSYMESGRLGPFLSVYITGWQPGDPDGTMETPVLVQAGARNYHDIYGRAGDFSGISVDTDGTFWIANEFANTELVADWGTTIAHFAVSEPAAAAQRALQSIRPPFGIGIFTDPHTESAVPRTVMVNWGGGTLDSASVASTEGSLTKRHIYAKEGLHTVHEIKEELVDIHLGW